jgi:hypothetical protein
MFQDILCRFKIGVISLLRDIWGQPSEFKDLKIYPVKLIDSDFFYENVGVLLINKNKIPDKNIIKMSNLAFLYGLCTSFDDIIKVLTNLFKLVLKVENVEFNANENNVFLQTDERIISEQDFDEIRKIILRQNMVPLDETMLDAELEQRLKEAEEFLAKRQGVAPTLEDKIVAYHCLSGMDYEKIKKLTIYQFNKGIERFILIKDYEVYTYPLLKCGEGEKIKSWLSHIEERGMYDHLLMTKEDFEQKTSDSSFKKM